MRSENLRSLRCKISRGGFSDERVFKIEWLGSSYSGVASRRHMWDERGAVIKDGEPPLDQSIEGLVAARIIEVDGDTVSVSVPDGEVIRLPASQLLARPTGVMENVPV